MWFDDGQQHLAALHRSAHQQVTNFPGGHLAIDSTLTIGTLTALATLLLRLLGPLQGLSNVRVDVMTALVSFDRVFEVLDLPSTVQEKPDAVDLPASAGRLEFDGVSFTYPRADEVSQPPRRGWPRSRQSRSARRGTCSAGSSSVRLSPTRSW